ncbi:MAG: hypothetical protein K2K23_01450, partial [Muribaculaceae bacterium]|nr:hypothetical protein [Muribaculaceae bacterium]
NESGLPHQPMILELYDVNKLKSGTHTLPIINDTIQEVHSAMNEEYLKNLEKTLVQLFDKNEPLNPTNNPASCSYCQFKTICWR